MCIKIRQKLKSYNYNKFCICSLTYAIGGRESGFNSNVFLTISLIFAGTFLSSAARYPPGICNLQFVKTVQCNLNFSYTHFTKMKICKLNLKPLQILLIIS